MRFSGKNKFISVLIIITVIVWGMIIHRIITHFSSDNDTETIPEIRSSLSGHRSSAPADSNIAYSILHRDPFSFATKMSEETIEIQHVNQQHTLQPVIQYNIDGVVIGGNKKLVILNDLKNQKAVFLREGEEYSGIKIKKIEYKRITLTENGTIKEIDLTN